MASAVRDRSREILRVELAAAASDFCAERGFDDVTVDEIAHEIGISRATFFRYFGSKEDAVVAAARAGRDSIADRVRELPSESSASAWAAILAAMQPTVEVSRVQPQRLRARIRMIGETPALRARLASDRADERVALAAVLQSRIGDATVGRAVAAAAIAAIDLAWGLWAEDPSADFGDSLAESFALVGSAREAHFVS